MEQIVEMISNVIKVLGVLGVVIEITPIKFSPLRWIGNRLNRSLSEKIEKTDRKVDELYERLDRDKVENIRSELLDFSNSCMNHRRHTEREFDNIFKKEIEYEKLCEKYKIDNGYTEENMKYVHEIYLKCKREGKFLEYEDKEDY